LDVEHHKSLARRAVYVEYDTWGSEYHYDGLSSSIGYEVGDPSDNQRVNALVEMIECGYVAQMLLSHDICFKTSLRQYGGYGLWKLSIQGSCQVGCFGLSRFVAAMS